MKIIQRLLTALFVVLATCCVLNIYNVRSETSKTFGNFDHYDLYEDFNVFEMDENVVFYNDNGTYKFTKTYPIKVDFNGSDNEYNLFVNNKPCDTIKSTAGSLYGIYGLSFYDINNQYICDFDLQIRYTFYVSNFELSIESNFTADELKYLNEYLNVNGFNLRIIEKVYYVPNEDVLSKVYASFYDENDTLLGVQNTLYNQTLSTPNYNVPEKTGYTFKGWTIDGKNVIDFETYKFTKNVKLKPYYEINKYTVTFKNGNEILSTQTVDYGSSATAPTVTPAIGYSHTGWDSSFNQITTDTIISATFEKIVYTINYYDDNAQLLQSKNYTIGESIDFTAPELTGHTFLSWNTDHYAYYPDNDIVLDTLDVDFITRHFSQSLILNVFARYEINTYTVTFKNGDTVLSTQTVAYNNNATAPVVTPEIGYTHSGWDKSLTNITEDTVISATFNKIQYTIIFYDCDQRDTSTVLGSEVFVIGDIINFAFESPQGYTFDGWSLDMYGLTGDLPTSFTLDASRISQIFTNSLVERGLIAHCTVNNYTLTFTDSYLKVRQGSSTGTVLTTGCSLPYGTTVYLTATRTNYTPTIKVNGVTNTNNSTITITDNTTITVDWTYVAPAKSWKTISTTVLSMPAVSSYNPCSKTFSVAGLTAGVSTRLYVDYSFSDYAGTSASGSDFLVISSGSQTPESDDGDSLSFTFSVSDGQLTFNYNGGANDVNYVRITKIEQYC